MLPFRKSGRRFCRVSESSQAVKKALEFNETEYSGRTIYVSKAGDREGRLSPIQLLMST